MSAPEHEIRAAAESLLSSASSYQQRQSPNLNVALLILKTVDSMPGVIQAHPGCSVNSRPDFLLPADLVTGSRQHGRMSVVRRFFCLFVTFDLLFTCLLWLVCIMLVGGDMMATLSKQIVHYNIHTSLFDIVLAAASRFTVLLLFYGLIYVNHWLIIAMSTAGTCMFLIAKVYLYHWSEAPQPAFHVLLILASFVISWGEAWFLDFRVLPQELQAEQFLQASPLCPDLERAPLLRNFLQGLPVPDETNESVGNFYSPMDSPQGSDDEREAPGIRRAHGRADRSRNKTLSAAQKDRYRQQAAEALEVAWSIVTSPDWKLEKQTASGESFFSKRLNKSKKVYKMICKLDFSPDVLFEELCIKAEDIPKWNPTITQVQIIQTIDAHTDILYMVAAGGAGGLVQSRDFVNLRHWSLKEDCYVAAAVAAMHPALPVSDKHIRGENGASCWVIRPACGSKGDSSEVEWLLNTNLRGWIPQSLVDSSLITAMLDYTHHLRQHVSHITPASSS